jgi:uracil-DNA glycosylase
MSYDALVCERKQCRKCADLMNPADPLHASLDGSEVGPWSRWLASKPAKLLLVGQDWGTVGYFRKHYGRDVALNKTNQNLRNFLALLGFQVGPPHETDNESGVFATNAILCLKPGSDDAMSAPVKQAWFSNCRPLLKRTIEEVSAPTVIALGKYAFESVVKAYDADTRPFREAVEEGKPINLDRHRLLFAVFHPAARPKDRRLSQMTADWGRIAEYLKTVDDLTTVTH